MVGGRLGVGFIGSGFITRFHLRSWRRVRDADVLGVWSPNARTRGRGRGASRATSHRRDARLRLHRRDGRRDPTIDCIWICGPNHARDREHGGDRRRAQAGRGSSSASPARSRSARNVAEAKRMRRARSRSGRPARLPREPALRAGRRARDARSLGARRGAHRPPLPRARGRGAQRAAHAVVLAGRPAGRRRAQRHDVPQRRGRRASAHRSPAPPRTACARSKVSAHIARLKWSRPEYAELLKETMGAEVDYAKRARPRTSRAPPSSTWTRRAKPLSAKSTTSWSFVGAGLRLSDRAARPGVLDVEELARDRLASSSSAGG